MPPKSLVPPKQPNSAAKAFKQVAEILNAGIWTFPQNDKYNGTGAPGRYLEDLLGIKENNADSPDLADWEIKFHGGTALLTLFHKDPKRKGIACSLTADDIANLLERCRGRCEVSGIPLNWSNPTGARYKPYSQSLDRIDSAGGYSLSNCRIVCYAVNLAMLSWGESVFSNIAVGYVMNKYVASSLVGALIEGHQAGRPNPPTA